MADTESDKPTEDSCNACKRPLPLGARYCEVCKSWQEKKCFLCGQWLPEEANRCNGCETSQGWFRRRLRFSQPVLSLLTALVGVSSPALIVTLILLNNHSHTSLMVTDVETDKLSAYAWNTGHKPGRLVTAILDFGPYEIETARLEPMDPMKTLIPGGSLESVVNGAVVEFRMPAQLKERAKSRQEKAKSPSFCVDVKESNDKARRVCVSVDPSKLSAIVDQKRALDQVVKP